MMGSRKVDSCCATTLVVAVALAVACSLDSSGSGVGHGGELATGGAGSTSGPSDAPNPTTDPTTDSATDSATDSGVSSAGTTTGPSPQTTTETTTETTMGSTSAVSGDTTSDRGTTSAGCVPEVELCDGADNDCDGAIDEGSPQNEACGDCEFVVSADGTAYFAVCTPAQTWSDARTSCEAFGPDADLAVIDDANDQAALLALVTATDHWIGLSDLDVEGHWVWVDGTDSIVGGVVLDFNGWAAGQPEGGAENCGELDPGKGGWADSPCDELQLVICRHPA